MAENDSTRPADHLQPWLNHLSAERGLSPLTLKHYKESLGLFRRWCEAKSREQVTREDVQQFLVYLMEGRSARSAYRHLCALRSFYRFLHSEEIISVNPTRGLKTPRCTKKLPGWLNENQTRALLRAAETANSFLAIRDAVLLHLLYGSGLRVSEAVSICKSDLEPNLSAVRVRGKGAIERIAPLSAQSQSLLHRYLSSQYAPQGEYLFPRHQRGSCRQLADKPISRQWVWKLVRETAKAAGVSCHPHTLRHSAASHMTQRGADVSHVQAFLGHASPETTMIYSHLDVADLRRAFNRYHPRAKVQTGASYDYRRTRGRVYAQAASREPLAQHAAQL